MFRTAAALGFALILTTAGSAAGQGSLDEIDSLIQRINVDSLRSYIRLLSGVDSIAVTDSVQVYRSDSLLGVTSRWYADTTVSLDRRYHIGNEVAAAWLVDKLESFGYTDVRRSGYEDSPWMENVWVEKRGTDRPDQFYVICAHYDGVRPQYASDNSPRPAADDNASGTASVLEAARVMASLPTRTSVIFAFWDSEEVGLDGSRAFAVDAAQRGQDITAAVNLDMVGWDGDGDRALEIHADEQSTLLAEEVKSTITDFGLDLRPVTHNPGARNSDHASFWNQGYPAVMLIEELRGGDFNPRYHAEGDRLEYLDLQYLRENARLAVAVVSRLALSGASVRAEIPSPTFRQLESVAWPVPFSNEVNIRFSVGPGSTADIRIFDVTGREVDRIIGRSTEPGSQVVTWRPPASLADGVLIYTIETENRGRVSSGFLALRR